MNNDTINVDISKKWQLLLWKVFLSAAIMFMVVEVIICLVKKDLGMPPRALREKFCQEYNQKRFIICRITLCLSFDCYSILFIKFLTCI